MPATREVTEDQAAVTSVLRAFTKSFVDFDTDRFISLWDTEAPFIVYQPEELHHTMFDLGELRVYIDKLPGVVRAMRDVKVVDFKIDVDGDVATVFVRFWARLSFAKIPQTVDGQIRQTFIARRRSDGWKLTHYHESRQAPGFELATGEW